MSHVTPMSKNEIKILANKCHLWQRRQDKKCQSDTEPNFKLCGEFEISQDKYDRHKIDLGIIIYFAIK